MSCAGWSLADAGPDGAPMTFRPATDADRAAWQDLLGRVPSGDFLHDWAWAAVAAHDGQPQRRFVIESEGALVALAAGPATGQQGGGGPGGEGGGPPRAPTYQGRHFETK